MGEFSAQFNTVHISAESVSNSLFCAELSSFSIKNR